MSILMKFEIVQPYIYVFRIENNQYIFGLNLLLRRWLRLATASTNVTVSVSKVLMISITTEYVEQPTKYFIF